VADSRIVLMIRGLRSLATEWRRKPRGPEEEERWGVPMENPPLMTATHIRKQGVIVQHRLGRATRLSSAVIAGSCGRETMVATPTSRIRVMMRRPGKDKG
jgi:hypothetical protein